MAKKYADYILQRNKSFKRKAHNEALEQLKSRKETIGRKNVSQKEKKIHWRSSIKEARKHWKKIKERARQVEAEEKEKFEVERRERTP